MRRTLAAVAVALLAATAGCSAPADTSNPTANGPSSGDVTQPSSGTQRTIAVGASGQVQTAPDRAVVRVAVTARADSVEAVRGRLAENASRMREALRAAGLAAGQITSARYDIGRNYEHEDRPSAPEFEGRHAFVVALNETDRAGDIVVVAVENGATSVEEVRFTVAPDTRRDLRERALSRAVENARGKAAVAANGTGLEVRGVRGVRTGDVSVQPLAREDVAFATGGDGGGGVPTSFEGGKVTVGAQVTVVYNATSTGD
ncbi:SIMPL domain-containing protein [Salinirubellus sp. GCM10025818]|uniref:SIMPL domain-containing protein n=1 Tax=Salinirubellus TaxID=2162630 RepID=UPI0030CB7886